MKHDLACRAYFKEHVFKMTIPEGAKTCPGRSGKRLLEIFHWTLTSRDKAISCEIQRASIPRLKPSAE